GEWDKRMIIYGYQDFPSGVNEEQALNQIIHESIDMGLKYLSDDDARGIGTASPYAHLWDNGNDPIAEFNRLAAIRKQALAAFNAQRIPEGTHLAYLEQVLVPIYYGHRYQ